MRSSTRPSAAWCGGEGVRSAAPACRVSGYVSPRSGCRSHGGRGGEAADGAEDRRNQRRERRARGDPPRRARQPGRRGAARGRRAQAPHGPRQADQGLGGRLPAAPREGQGEARPRAGIHPLMMRMSRERIFHLADLILKALGTTAGVSIRAPDDLRPEVIRALTEESKLAESIDGEVRKILGSYSRPMPEGSHEWEVLYQKTREEVFRKRFRL